MYFWCVFATLVLYFQNGKGTLWPKGVVHFSISNKDYDIHSQDIILSTLGSIEKEVCVKFFGIPPGYNASARVLYINNPDKRKNCPPNEYNFTGTVVDMPIGYKCIDPKNIARIVAEMLRASIEQTVQIINSYDLIKKFQERDEDPSRPYLLQPGDRNFINAHYHAECGTLSQPDRTQFETRRSGGTVTMTNANEEYYRDKLWPLGIIMYGVQKSLRDTPDHIQLKFAMTTIELGCGVVFREVQDSDKLLSKSLLWFADVGADAPAYGFKEGNQTLSLRAIAEGAPGHKAHTLNMLLRAMGVPMMSNRPDRDNHILVNWDNVEKGKEHLLEKHPMDAWIHDGKLPYDFESATHAPANFVCKNCSRGESTVEPLQDNLWQRVLWSMGRQAVLSEGDMILLDVIYNGPIRARHVAPAR